LELTPAGAGPTTRSVSDLPSVRLDAALGLRPRRALSSGPAAQG